MLGPTKQSGHKRILLEEFWSAKASRMREKKPSYHAMSVALSQATPPKQEEVKMATKIRRSVLTMKERFAIYEYLKTKIAYQNGQPIGYLDGLSDKSIAEKFKGSATEYNVRNLRTEAFGQFPGQDKTTRSLKSKLEEAEKTIQSLRQELDRARDRIKEMTARTRDLWDAAVPGGDEFA